MVPGHVPGCHSRRYLPVASPQAVKEPFEQHLLIIHLLLFSKDAYTRRSELLIS